MPGWLPYLICWGVFATDPQARVLILDRTRYCYRGNRAADARRHLQQARWRSRAAHARCHGRPRGRYSLLHRRP